MTMISDLNVVLITLYSIGTSVILFFMGLKFVENTKEVKENAKIAQDNLKIQLQNESFTLAKEQSQFFTEKIKPLYLELVAELAENKSFFFDKYEVRIYGEFFSLKLIGAIDAQDIEGVQKSKYLKTVLNYLESFSMYFTSGISCEQIGFLNSGEEYCEIVKRIAPILVPEFRKGNYENTQNLFVTWNKRSAKEILTFKQRMNGKLKRKVALAKQLP